MYNQSVKSAVDTLKSVIEGVADVKKAQDVKKELLMMLKGQGKNGRKIGFISLEKTKFSLRK